MSDEKIAVENPNTPGRSENVRADKYHDMRAALLKVLPDTAPGLPFAALKEGAKAHLSETLFPDGKTSGWWAKCVQLDLEAKGLLLRTTSKPLTFYKA
ncbi:MAG: hypothetical protein WBC85_11275 [Planktotalea sp.]|uniref:DUF6958 family protein n=1 Tax=Planktotalea sp. TaxID=2029877 RepID=UPI003C778FAF